MGLAAVFILLSAFIAVGTRHTLTSEAVAQTSVSSDPGPGLHLGHDSEEAFEPLVDGSKRPEEIPDGVAIRVLMQTLRVPPNPDAAALKQLQVRVARVNLSETDFEILVRELGVLDARAQEQEARMEAVRTSLAGTVSGATARPLEDRYIEEQANFSSLVDDHYQQLLQSLSPEGAEKLRGHLLHVKARIKIYPTPDMSKRTL
jgi:hypothetical protein